MPSRDRAHFEKEIPLKEAYDLQYGFITDAFIDAEPERSVFMARPSVQVGFDFGIPTNYGDVGSPIIPDGIFVFNIPGAFTFTYAVVLYHSVLTSPPSFNHINFGVMVWNLSNGLSLGNFPGEVLFTAKAFTDLTVLQKGARATSATGTYLLFTLNNIQSGGSGYAVNDTITLNIPGAFGVSPTITVTSIGAGGSVTGATLAAGSYAAAYAGNPVGQSSTSGGGTGATFNLNTTQNVGIAVQSYIGDTMITLVMVNQSNGTASVVVIGPSGYNNAGNALSLLSSNSYVITLGQDGFLRNSNPGDVSQWNGLAFTQAFSDMGTIPVGTASHTGYLLVLGSNEVRMFYVTGATNGSAFAPVLNTSFGIGCSNANTISQLDEYVFFLGEQDGNSVRVYMYEPNSQVPKPISYPYLERLFNSYTFFSGRAFRFLGHLAYALQATTGAVFIYDAATQDWYQWQPPNYGVGGSFSYLSSSGDTAYMLGYDSTSGHLFAMNLQQATTDGLYGGGTSTYTGQITTRPIDFGTMSYKQWEAVALVGDETLSAVNVSLQYSDNQGQTFSPARTLPLNVERPITRNLGQSRRRCWRLTIPATAVVRLQALSLIGHVGSG